MDIWHLGVVFYLILTGFSSPFMADEGPQGGAQDTDRDMRLRVCHPAPLSDLSAITIIVMSSRLNR